MQWPLIALADYSTPCSWSMSYESATNQMTALLLFDVSWAQCLPPRLPLQMHQVSIQLACVEVCRLLLCATCPEKTTTLEPGSKLLTRGVCDDSIDEHVSII